jgi:hypothetical protein
MVNLHCFQACLILKNNQLQLPLGGGGEFCCEKPVLAHPENFAWAAWAAAASRIILRSLAVVTGLTVLAFGKGLCCGECCGKKTI